jgi:hypothetical protein
MARYSNGDSHPFDRKIWSALVSAGVHAEEFAQWQVEINSDYHGKNMPGLPINEVAVNDMRKVMIDQRSFMEVIQESIVATRVMANNVSQLSGSMMTMSNQCQVIVEAMNRMTDTMALLVEESGEVKERLTRVERHLNIHSLGALNSEGSKRTGALSTSHVRSPVNLIAPFKEIKEKVRAADNPEQAFLQWILNRGAESYQKLCLDSTTPIPHQMRNFASQTQIFVKHMFCLAGKEQTDSVQLGGSADEVTQWEKEMASVAKLAVKRAEELLQTKPTRTLIRSHLEIINGNIQPKQAKPKVDDTTDRDVVS